MAVADHGGSRRCGLGRVEGDARDRGRDDLARASAAGTGPFRRRAFGRRRGAGGRDAAGRVRPHPGPRVRRRLVRGRRHDHVLREPRGPAAVPPGGRRDAHRDHPRTRDPPRPAVRRHERVAGRPVDRVGPRTPPGRGHAGQRARRDRRRRFCDVDARVRSGLLRVPTVVARRRAHRVHRVGLPADALGRDRAPGGRCRVGRFGRAVARGRGGRAGVDLPAGLGPRRFVDLRLGSYGLVEPVPGGGRRRADEPDADVRRVRRTDVELRLLVVRVPVRREDRVHVP